MTQAMFSVEQVSAKIEQGRKLLLAGDEALLRQLPPGDWIAGTSPYFMTDRGGQCNRQEIHVSELPDFVAEVEIRGYDETTISNIYNEMPENGVSFIIIPAGSPTHYAFALDAPTYENFAVRPLIGWISGVLLDDMGAQTPKVFNGHSAEVIETAAIVMHVTLPRDKIADIGIINIFAQGDGDSIVFPRDGFSTELAYVNGQPRNFRNYLVEKKLDTRLPLVADYYGVSINTSIREGSQTQRNVEFYAPVFSTLCYKHARPVTDYISAFTSQLPVGLEHQIVFSCNCILNYIHSEMEGKIITGITGPTTFGEIAYMSLNQTMVYVRIIDIPARR